MKWRKSGGGGKSRAWWRGGPRGKYLLRKMENGWWWNIGGGKDEGRRNKQKEKKRMGKHDRKQEEICLEWHYSGSKSNSIIVREWRRKKPENIAKKETEKISDVENGNRFSYWWRTERSSYGYNFTYAVIKKWYSFIEKYSSYIIQNLLGKRVKKES